MPPSARRRRYASAIIRLFIAYACSFTHHPEGEKGCMTGNRWQKA